MQQWCRWSTSASFPMIVSSSTVTSAKLRNEKKKQCKTQNSVTSYYTVVILHLTVQILRVVVQVHC